MYLNGSRTFTDINKKKPKNIAYFGILFGQNSKTFVQRTSHKLSLSSVPSPCSSL